jgi:hypothetical protein
MLSLVGVGEGAGCGVGAAASGGDGAEAWGRVATFEQAQPSETRKISVT